jgi:hypothetical protein
MSHPVKYASLGPLLGPSASVTTQLGFLSYHEVRLSHQLQLRQHLTLLLRTIKRTGWKEYFPGRLDRAPAMILMALGRISAHEERYEMTTPAPAEGIEVTGRHNPLAWLLYFIKLTVEVDGQAEQGSWRLQRFTAVTPGEHTVKVFFKYFTKARCCEAGTVVQVEPGQVIRLDYRAPQLMTSPGKLKVVT